MSIRDHMFKEGFAFPTFYCNERFAELDEATQIDQIIELGIPWYFNFYVSWYEATSSNRIEALWMQYENVIESWVEALTMISQFYTLNKTKQEIEDALQRTMNMKKDRTRLNKGVAGRGDAALSDEQKEKIIEMSRFYPWVDFSLLGIEK